MISVIESEIPTCKKELARKNFITAHQLQNYWPRLRLEDLNTKYRYLLELLRYTLNSMGFDIQNRILGLIPINIERYYYLLARPTPAHLLHEGFQKSTQIFETQFIHDDIPEFNNQKNMQDNGVWGNPHPHMATFLKPPDSRVVPMARNGLGIRLVIDYRKLSTVRNIYIDPEMYIPAHMKGFNENGAEHDIPGNSLMVFGGIPASAIIGMEKITIKEL